MILYILLIVFTSIFCSVILILSYKIGVRRALQHLASFLIPAVLGGTAIHIGHFVLPNFKDITYYIAGITTIIFYFILSPVLLKRNSDRYSKISKLSKITGCVIILLYLWSVLSFGMFFVHLIYKKHTMPYDKIIDVITMPICLIWITPSENQLISDKKNILWG